MVARAPEFAKIMGAEPVCDRQPASMTTSLEVDVPKVENVAAPIVQGSPQLQHKPFSYRPDIDGLRAVAVFVVILFHLNTAWLPGGFIGVDVFFVISGYVVTCVPQF